MLWHGHTLSPAPFRLQWSQAAAPYEPLASPYDPSASPPDIVVQVAGHRFHAHRSVLAAHSGYFKCILSDYSAPPSSQKLPELLFLTLSIPSVSSKLFAVLLDFMYSSQLRLDVHSVADVLFGAQLLRMQSAVDACHHHLLQLQRLFGYQPVGLYPVPLVRSLSPDCFPQPVAPPPLHAGIVRPIPTTGTPAYFAPYQPYPRHSFGARFVPWSSATETHPRGAEEETALPRLTQDNAESMSERDLKVRALRCFSGLEPLNPATSQQERYSPAPSSSTQYSSGSGQGPSSADSTPCPAFPPSDADEGTEETGDAAKDASVNAVIDIACCDGPVKFQRVLNENCSLVIMMTAATAKEATSHSRPSNSESRPISDGSVSGKSSGPAVKSGTCCQTAADEVEKPSSRSSTPNPTATVPENKPGGSTGSLYHCMHCKHSFKSRCCYMKHRWRHLNPLTLESQYGRRKPRASHREAQPETSTKAEQVTSTSGDVRKPLEINVPFYPCKVCGCKFPSYYFVHKHRRMCHQKRRPKRGHEEGDGSDEDSRSDTSSGDGDGNATTTDNYEEGEEDSQGVE